MDRSARKKLLNARTILTLLSAHLLCLGLARAADPGKSILIQTFSTHSRLAIRMDEGAPAEWKDLPGGFEVSFKGIALADLGAPLGHEQAWMDAQLQSARDSRLESLKIRETEQGVVITGKWKFPSGKAALAEPKMERFDYREKSPPRYVVDFWLKKGPTLVEAEALRKKRAREQELRQAEAQAKRRAERRLASQKAREESEDVLRFCKLPLSPKGDVFLPFLPIHPSVDFAQWFPMTTPDSQYIYLSPDKDASGKDGEYVKLALSLYQKGDFALTIRTLDFLDTEHPKSGFRNDMQFLRANALIKLGLKPQAEQVLERLLVDAKGSPAGLYAGMYMAQKALESGRHLMAMERFLWLVDHYSAHRLAWVFHMGAAESLYALKQTERAAKEYQWVIENAPSEEYRAQGAMKLGDLYLVRQQYEQALAAYFQGINSFKAQSDAYAPIAFNRAETLYGLGEYDRAEAAFKEALQKFPGHPAGWRASFRLGEIYGRKAQGVESAEGKESRRWFYDTINRFPYSAGATLARARLIPCGDHGGFDLAGSRRYFTEEAAKLTDREDIAKEVVLDKYPDFKALAEVRSLVAFGQESQAVDLAITELRKNFKGQNRWILGNLMGSMFRKSVIKLLGEGKKYEALAFYRDRFEQIPRANRYGDPEQPIEPDYFLQLSQAAADLGFGKLAEQLTEHYRQATAEHRLASRELATVPPKAADPDIDEKLKLAEQRFTEAKAMWVSSGVAAESRIRQALAQVTEESEHSYEREIILGLLNQGTGKSATALQNASKAQLLMPAGDRPEDKSRIQYWIASLQDVAGDAAAALRSYRELESFKREERKPAQLGEASPAESLGLPEVPSKGELILRQGAILSRQGRWGEAAQAYSRAVEEGSGGNQAMFEYARALSKTGTGDGSRKSLEVLEKLAQSKTEDFWKKLAEERLASEKGEFKKTKK